MPLARLKKPDKFEARFVLDYGAAGIIIPMIETRQQLEEIVNEIIWPPGGKRGVGFCNANGYGEHFNEYSKEANKPFIIAMIENKVALENIDDILATKNLDAIIIGPYDLSASLGVTGDFSNKNFLNIKIIFLKAVKKPKFLLDFI